MKEQEEGFKRAVVITGATSGIGLAAAQGLARCGFRVIGVGRSQERCIDAEAAIRTRTPGAVVEYLAADLGSQREVRALADAIRQRLGKGQRRLDCLINNAATVSSWYMATEDGYEMQFAVNYLAPFLLTRELLPVLRPGSARVITTSSGSHFRTRMRWDDPMFRRGYACLSAYRQSKLAVVIFTNELNRRLGSASGIRAYAADPGLVDTAIGEKGTRAVIRWFWRIRRRRGIPPEQAAATIVHLATSRELEDPAAGYWKDCRPQPCSPYACREDVMLRLWEMSERLCGVAGASQTGATA